MYSELADGCGEACDCFVDRPDRADRADRPDRADRCETRETKNDILVYRLLSTMNPTQNDFTAGTHPAAMATVCSIRLQWGFVSNKL
jgi:hypothetical protein